MNDICKQHIATVCYYEDFFSIYLFLPLLIFDTCFHILLDYYSLLIFYPLLCKSSK